MRSIALLCVAVALGSCKFTFHAAVEDPDAAKHPVAASAPGSPQDPGAPGAGGEQEPPAPPAEPTLSGPPQAISLLGETLLQLVPPPEERAELDEAVNAAQDIVDLLPSVQGYIWLGRRLSSAYRYVEAVQAFEQARNMTSRSDPVALRYLGHRYITVRQFDRAEHTLLDGIERAHDSPPILELRSDPDPLKSHPVTIQHNLYYHLGVVRFLEHRFEESLEAWQECLALSDNPDMLCGATHWTYMTLRRLGRHEEARALLAPITPELDVRESKGYHRLCLFYKGLLKPEELIAEDESGIQKVTLGYGLANWLLCEGRTEEANARFRELAQSPYWMAFARMAAEAEVLRM